MEQKVFAPTIFVFMAALGIIAYIFLSSSYPKTSSSAQEPLSILITEPLDRTILLGSSTTFISTLTSENIKISKVEVYADDSLLCLMVSSPYVCKWQVPPRKGHQFTISAKAFGSLGDTASSEVTVTVR